ncbi:MAG: hypothetical protein QME60_02395 [Verrucomicrobiota bacterium]|nr:hypothetical protein [Verrucomicrobiota bacterium]
MNQIFFGMLIPFVVALAFYARRRCRASPPMLVRTPFCMALGALWATIPDLPRLLGRPDLYHRLARDSRADICLWHYTIDRIERDSIWHIIGVAAMLASLLLAAWRELRIREDL